MTHLENPITPARALQMCDAMTDANCDVFSLVSISGLTLVVVARWLFTLESIGAVIDTGGGLFTWAHQDIDGMAAMAQAYDDARMLIQQARSR